MVEKTMPGPIPAGRGDSRSGMDSFRYMGYTFNSCRMRVYSLSTWNYLKAYGTEAALGDSLSRIRAMDFGAEIWLNWTPNTGEFDKRNWSSIRDLCAGLPTLSAHTALTKAFSLDQLLTEMDLCSFIGASPLVCHPRTLGLDDHTWDYTSDRQLTDRDLERIERILVEARQRSLGLALENGPADTLERVVRSTAAHEAHDTLGICIDTGHANMHLGRSASPVVDILTRLGRHLTHLHVSDNRGSHDDHAVPGTGMTDWDAVIGTVVAFDYAGPIVFELNVSDPDAAAEQARTFFRRRMPGDGADR